MPRSRSKRVLVCRIDSLCFDIPYQPLSPFTIEFCFVLSMSDFASVPTRALRAALAQSTERENSSKTRWVKTKLLLSIPFLGPLYPTGNTPIALRPPFSINESSCPRESYAPTYLGRWLSGSQVDTSKPQPRRSSCVGDNISP